MYECISMTEYWSQSVRTYKRDSVRAHEIMTGESVGV